MGNYVLISIAVILFISCETSEKTSENNTGVTVETTHWGNGNKKSVIRFKDDLREGWSYSYNQRGKMRVKAYYHKNYKDSDAFIFYPNGKLRQHSKYKRDTLDGLRKKYRADGKTASIVTYTMGLPCDDLKEYLLDGSEKKDHPQLKVREKNEILINGSVIVIPYVTGDFRSVTFYRATEPAGKCPDTNQMMELPKISDSSAKIVIPVPKGTFRMQEIYLMAKIRTRQGNPLLLKMTYNLAVEH